VTITVQGSARTGTATVRAASQAFLEAVDAPTARRAVLVRPDGSFVNAATNPARRGEIIRMYVTGLGGTLPLMSTNSIPVPGSDSVPTGTLIVGVNDSGAAGVGEGRSQPHRRLRSGVRDPGDTRREM
jgi:uncharacterized protein (TIGR03437 family)